ncbi:MAG TPA: hypothetical protein PK598_02760 [Thermoanaerobaculia bacterium]|nr:hypothetical protein [Thermoanaerobaculia bacterium]
MGRLERAAEARDVGGLGELDREGGADVVLQRGEEEDVDAHPRMISGGEASPIESARGGKEP